MVEVEVLKVVFWSVCQRQQSGISDIGAALLIRYVRQGDH
jgi:hypothetical protein